MNNSELICYNRQYLYILFWEFPCNFSYSMQLTKVERIADSTNLKVVYPVESKKFSNHESNENLIIPKTPARKYINFLLADFTYFNKLVHIQYFNTFSFRSYYFIFMKSCQRMNDIFLRASCKLRYLLTCNCQCKIIAVINCFWQIN